MCYEVVVEDKRGRTWEMFCDISYFDMWCVRVAADRDFNSPTSFHFTTRKKAEKFLHLVQESC